MSNDKDGDDHSKMREVRLRRFDGNSEETRTSTDDVSTVPPAQNEAPQEASSYASKEHVHDEARERSGTTLPVRYVPMTMNISETEYLRLQTLMDQFLKAMSVVRLINNVDSCTVQEDVKVTDVEKEVKVVDVKEELNVETSSEKSINITPMKPAMQLRSRQLQNSQPRPGCSRSEDKNETICIQGSSSEERAKKNRFFRPHVKHSDSSDEDFDLTPASKKKRNVYDDSDLSEDFHQPHRKKITPGRKELKGAGASLPNQMWNTTSSSDVDDPSPIKSKQQNRKMTKAKMLEAMSAFFKPSQGKGSKKRKQAHSSAPEDMGMATKAKAEDETKPEETEDDDPYRGRCSICLERSPVCLLRCKHLYCEECCRKFKRAKKPCPKCQKRFRTWDVVFF